MESDRDEGSDHKSLAAHFLSPESLPPQRTLKLFSAVFIENGVLRHMWFEAVDESEARSTCSRLGAALEGETARLQVEHEPMPELYNAETARRILGGISRSTLYKEIVLGRLERVPGIRRILITRSSLERRCRSR